MVPSSLKWLAVAMATSVATLFAAMHGHTEQVRYRATAIVQIDGATMRGSVVRDTAYTDTPYSLTGFALGIRDTGDAIVLAPPGRPKIYVLITDKDQSKAYPPLVMKCFGVSALHEASIAAQFSRVPIGGRCRIDPPDMKFTAPLLVAFTDETVPRSVYAVTAETYAAHAGVSAHFLGMELERVDSSTPMKSVIATHLPWLDDIPFEGSTIRTLQPYDASKMLARDATLAMKLADHHFRD